MNTKQLPYFIAIAETGNLSAASQKLGISQPALSKFLNEAEHAYGLPLFYREKRRMYPTEAGNIVINAARQIFETHMHTQNAILALKSNNKQTIRIGVTPHRGAQAMAMAYPHLLKRFPDVELNMFEGYASSLWQKLYADELDLILTTATSEHRNLHILPFYDEEIVLSVPVFHHLAHLGSKNADTAMRMGIEDFVDSPFVMSGKNSTLGKIFTQIIEEKGLELTIAFASDNILVVNEMIHTGAGVGLIPRYYAEPREDVVYFRLKEKLCFTQCIARRRGRSLTQAERYLLYLKTRLYDRKQISSPEYMHWTDELREILTEFDPNFIENWKAGK
ncbi:MAG: LysR family transcriptional regulator [Candidatus Heteroscillospira sp.]|jgi:DNA-binding transcriptional LysR family regulator